jgi:hypothetical protein
MRKRRLLRRRWLGDAENGGNGVISSHGLIDVVETVIMLDGVIHEDLLIHIVKQDVDRRLLEFGGGRGRGPEDDNVQLRGVPEDVVVGRGEGVALPVEREVGVVGVREEQGVGRGVQWQGARGRGRGEGPGERVQIGHIGGQVIRHCEF